MTRQSKHTRLGLIAVVAVLALAVVGSGGAAAADPADTEIVFTENATDIDDSGPLPPDYETRGFIAVQNTTGGELTSSEVSFDAGGVGVDEVYRAGPRAVEGYVNASDIPDDGLNVSVSVNGTQIGSTTVYNEPVGSDSATVNSSTLKNADNISVEIDSAQLDDSDLLVGYFDGSYHIQVGSQSERLGSLQIASVQDSTTRTTNQTTVIGGEAPDQVPQLVWDDFTSVDEDPTTLYFSDAIEEIRIDGETIYEDSGPLGGGAGGSTDNQLLILVVIGGAAALVLLSD